MEYIDLRKVGKEGLKERKVFLILDNLKVHHGKLAAAWLEKRKDK